MTIIKTPNQIRDDILRTMKEGLIDIGVSNPQTDPGTDLFVDATAVGSEIAIAANNVLVRSDQLLPDTAEGEDLDRLLGVYGLSRRGASTSSGFITLTTSTPTLVSTGAQLTGNNGLIYEVLVGGSYSNGDEIEARSVDTGAATNVEANDVLEWNDTPAFAQTTATVSQPITGGVDAEDDATARARLLDRLRNSPGLGNWQQVAEVAESINNVVQKAFIYPACNGPGTVHVALAAYPTSTSKTREVSTSDLANLRSAIQGQMPEYVETTVTTVNDVETNLSLSLTIPYPKGANTLGTGGGWLNFNPWPIANITAGYRYAKVESKTSNLEFVVRTIGTDVVVGGQTGFAPEPGITQISWIDRTNFTVRKATIVALNSTGTNDLFSIKIDSAFNGVAVGDIIFPACENAQLYVDTILGYFANMGPGEKVSTESIVARAARKPRKGLSWFANINTNLQRDLFESSEEVLNSSFLARETSANSAEIGSSGASLPTSVNNPPNILIPKLIGFYPAEL